MSFTNSKKGFTLTEVLVYILILSLIFLAISSFFVWVTRINNKLRATREVLTNLQRVMGYMRKEIIAAESIYTPTTTQEQLSLETKRYLPEGEDTTFIDFYLCEKHLCLKKESEEPFVLTSDKVEVNNLSFTQIGTSPPSLQINLEISSKTYPHYPSTVNITSSVSLRSY